MTTERERDRKFRLELVPQGAALLDLAAAAVIDLLAHEDREGVRQRRRKPADLSGTVNAVHIIIANLAHFILFPPGDGVSLILPMGHPRGVQAEAPQAGFGKGLRETVEGLSAIGLLILQKPSHARQATTIAPTAAFRMKVLAAGVSGGDIGRRNAFDRLRLSRKHKDKTRTYIPVPDTAEAQLVREQVDAINAGLAEANITYVGNTPVDVGDRYLVRHFSHPIGVDIPCLDYGGRLYGGCWQNMEKHLRANLRIGGEPLAELDYGQVFPRLAYAMAGAVLPAGGDLYAFPALEAEAGNACRDGVKRGFSALLWGTKRWNDEITPLLPRTWPVSRFRKELVLRHPAIAHFLTPDRIPGYLLSRMESNILVAVMLACLGQRIVALPIHDAVLVPISVVGIAQGIMEREALRIAGVPIPVALKS